MISGAVPLNAFCVDLEEWFHICGVDTVHSNPATWDRAPAHVVSDTEVLLRLLDENKSKGTFLTVGWVAEKYPQLIRKIANAGHEIGCHSYRHELVYTLTPVQFEDDLKQCLALLRDVSGQPVTTYRAPGFSIRNDCFWVYPILKRNGIDVDVSLVPAARDHGGVQGMARDPFMLQTVEGSIKCFPVSVMNCLGRLIPFSGGGYLRLLPQVMIDAGFRQNHRQGRVGMSYIHPREINVNQPRLNLPTLKYFKYYVNLAKAESKLIHLLQTFPFTTVQQVINSISSWPEFHLRDDQIVALGNLSGSRS